MDYEKKYKKALEKAREIYKEDFKAMWLENLFPELKESDDEKIRKQIISFLKEFECDHYRNLDFSSWIAWLEKQGEKPDYNPYKATVESIATMVEKYANTDDLKDFYDNIKVKCKDAVEYDNTWLEKQHVWSEEDEYQFNTILHGLDLKREIYKKKKNKVEEARYNTQYNWLKERVKPQIICDVEPKFKVGDWITCKKVNTALILDIEDGKYFAEHVDGNKGFHDIDYVDNHFHLWSIVDAKDGDVLVNGSNIFKFHFIIGTRVRGYCHVNTDDGRFYNDIGDTECFGLIDDVFTPATKEQCDLLFQKMAEAGYNLNKED